MTLRRRIELYAVIITLVAVVRLFQPFLVHHAPSDGTMALTPGEVAWARQVFFLDRAFSYLPQVPHWARNVINLWTASLWGLGLGCVLAVALVDSGGRWRFTRRRPAD